MANELSNTELLEIELARLFSRAATDLTAIERRANGVAIRATQKRLTASRRADTIAWKAHGRSILAECREEIKNDF